MPHRAASTPPSSPPEAPMRSATAPPAAFSPPAIAPINPRRHVAGQELQEARHRFFEAQRHCAHDAGVFVGNLSIRLTDLQLLHEVQRAFRKYGQCEVMVNRTDVVNGHGKPWAIVQFKSSAEACKAISDNQRVIIDNRATRISRLEAPRAI